MSAIKNLDHLISAMKPKLMDGEFVFCTVAGELCEYTHLGPVATFLEPRGLTLVLPEFIAQDAGLKYEGVFRQIVLTVHSSLEAVGLTAAVSTKLASNFISANVIAAYYHDHIFIPSEKAELALLALKDLSNSENFGQG